MTDNTQPAPSLDDELKPLRDRIDTLDQTIIRLLNDRAGVALEVGEVKKRYNAPAFRPEREAEVLRKIVAGNPGPLRGDSLHFIYREIMSACRALENTTRVAFLGPVGTFSEAAVFAAFGKSVEGQPCASIDEVFRATEAGTADYGVVPVENSTEGVVNRTLDLLLHTPLRISGEVEIPVHHNLMTRSGNMDGIARICAHAQALAQCATWLSTHYPDIERVPVASNAEAARMARDDASVAGVASAAAATNFGVHIVARNIQDDPHNSTRFAVIGTLDTAPSGRDQTSLVVSTPNIPGAVHKLLEPLARNEVSMTRFESRPNRTRVGTGVWTYYFYIDIEGHQRDPKVAAALAELRQLCGFFKVLGSYPLT
ncbi:prephenate dehydratase [Derxia lacustris]|uniref:prephenate dehydratase n=1 Tax=Derxia lacustris TaxID=764842 RepID=UPI000A16E312|nr:prephenate dehydratase [Derxia lacustris]